MEPRLPHGTIGVFRSARGAKRGDIVLVEHPELGSIVRSVYAVSRTGRVSLHAFSRSGNEAERAGMVAPECIKGRLVLRVFGSALFPKLSRKRKKPAAQPAREQ